MFGAISKATDSSFKKGMTFCCSIYAKKVMKLLSFIFEQPSYVLEKVQKLSDAIEGKCFRKDIYTLLVGHLDINHHRITGLLDAIDECDAAM